MELASILSTATGLAAILAVASVLRQRDTIQVLKENNSALEEKIKIQQGEIAEQTKHIQQCGADHQTSQKQIAELTAQVNLFRDLPFKEIQDTQAQILGTQKEIVELLTSIKGNTK